MGGYMEKENTVVNTVVIDYYSKPLNLEDEAAIDSDFAEFLEAVKNFRSEELRVWKEN
jgi:hypothetical protein